MLKKLGFPVLALAAMLLFAAPAPASARVRFGVTIGPAPVYPVNPYNPYCSVYNPYYCNPYGYGYAYPGPYVYGGWGGYYGWGGHVHHGREFHGDREFHGGHNFHSHEFHGGHRR